MSWHERTETCKRSSVISVCLWACHIRSSNTQTRSARRSPIGQPCSHNRRQARSTRSQGVSLCRFKSAAAHTPVSHMNSNEFSSLGGGRRRTGGIDVTVPPHISWPSASDCSVQRGPPPTAANDNATRSNEQLAPAEYTHVGVWAPAAVPLTLTGTRSQ